jgi:hypothetical protein
MSGQADNVSGSRPVAHAGVAFLLSVATLAGYAGCSNSTMEEGDAGKSGLGPDAGTTRDGKAGDAQDERDATPLDAGGGFDCSKDDAGDGLPNDLRCTGLYSDWDSKTITPDLLSFAPGFILWSDGALKQRWAYFPPGAKIDNSNLDEWTFPIGTIFYKQFSFGSLRIETRIFKKVGGTPIPWVWATYRWSADGESSATRLDEGETNVNGTTYEIPSHSACPECHHGRLDYNMGFDAINLGASTAQGVSLATLTAKKLLMVDVPPSLHIPDDGTGLATASLGWLHTNCGVACHNRNPIAEASITGLFLRVSAAQLVAEAGTVQPSDLDPLKTSVGVVPTIPLFASAGFYYITPGDPSLSLIPTLDGSRGDPNTPQMPPIISHQVDTTDVTALRNWIKAMPVDGGTPADGGMPADGGVPVDGG